MKPRKRSPLARARRPAEDWKIVYEPGAEVSDLEDLGDNRARAALRAVVCICAQPTEETVRVWAQGRMVRGRFSPERIVISNAGAERVRELARRADLASYTHELVVLAGMPNAALLNLVSDWREMTATCLIVPNEHFEGAPPTAQLWDEKTVKAAVKGISIIVRMPVETTAGPFFKPTRFTMPESIYEHFCALAKAQGWKNWKIRLTEKSAEESVFDVVEVNDGKT